MSQNYWELLSRPEWRAKRREILNLRVYRCQECNREQADLPTSLEVHHTYYERGLKPWEYPNESLKALCRPCHRRTQYALDSVKEIVSTLSLAQIEAVHGFIEGVQMRSLPHIPRPIGDISRALGIAISLGIDPAVVLAFARTEDNPSGLVTGDELLNAE